MINLVRPKFFIPVHGDYRHLKRHVELALATGVPEKAVLLEDGDVLDVSQRSASKNGKVTTGRICIDSGGSIDVVEDVVIRDRQHLSEDGIILPIIAINKRTGRVEGQPEIVMRGFAWRRSAAHRRSPRHRPAHPRRLQRRRKAGSTASSRKKSATTSSAFIQKSTSRRPLIMPVIMEI